MPRLKLFHQTQSITFLGMVLLFGALPQAVTAQTESGWRHRSSRHFNVTFDESTESLADPALGIAEATFSKLSGYFGWTYDVDKIEIVLLDDQDEANGVSFGRTPLVQIFCRKVPMEWRGETRWLETALSHELSHVYTLMQLQRPFAFSFGTSLHSDEQFSDIGSGFRVGIDNLPEWFVEGMAQVGSTAFDADGRDPYREALLGDAARHGLLLDLEEMGRFDGTSREYELAYNQGFDFLLFLQARYPKADFRSLCQKVSTDGMSYGFEEVYGKSLKELFQDWKSSLAVRFGKTDSSAIGPALFPSSSRPLSVETSASGRYAVANWEHDFLRFDLFEADGKGGYDRVERDVGEKVVSDPKTGSVWFAKSLRNTQKGADQFELFRRDRDGRVTQQTKNARCMVFDVRGNDLVYARYQGGKTTVLRRQILIGQEVVVHQFPYDTAVYEINIPVSGDSVYVILGVGTATRAALLESGNVRVLWPNSPSVRSLVPWKGDTLIFVGMDSLGPRLHWSLGEGAWHRLGAANAVRSVWVDELENGDSRLLASQIERGNRRVRRLELDRLATENVAADSTTKRDSGSNAAPRVWNPGLVRSVPPSLVRMPLSVDMGYTANSQIDRTDSSSTSAWSLSVSEEFVDPTLASGLGFAAGGEFFPSGKRMPTYLPAGSIWAWYGIGDLSFRAEYDYKSDADGMDFPDSGFYVKEDYGIHSASLTLSNLLSREGSVFLKVGYNWETYSYTVGEMGGQQRTHQEEIGKFLSAFHTETGLSYTQYDSRMDPAGLGWPGRQVWVQGSYATVTTKNSAGWRPDAEILSGSGGIAARGWLPGDLASVGLKLDGYGVFGGVDSSYAYPGSYVSMGGDHPFQAYADNNLRLRSWARGTLGLALSPFASRRSKVQWPDRLRISSNLEEGWIQYLSIDKGYGGNGIKFIRWAEKTAYATSWTLSLRQGFYGFGNQPSWFEVGYARPLVHLEDGRRDDPYRWFANLQIR